MTRCSAKTKSGRRCKLTACVDSETCYNHNNDRQQHKLECPVCLEQKHLIKTDTCSHLFCNRCLFRCVTCPLCRETLITNNYLRVFMEMVRYVCITKEQFDCMRNYACYAYMNIDMSSLTRYELKLFRSVYRDFIYKMKVFIHY